MKSVRFRKRFLLFSTLIVGMCSIIYELLISTVSSYFLGDSVKQFSIIIGFYLASMGLGSWLSRFIKKDKLFSFIWLELFLGIIGAFSVPLSYLYFSFADISGFNIFILGIIMIIGTLTGLEVPLLTQLLQENAEDKEDQLSDVLTLDYVGALVATLIFPFFLIPFMGIYKSSLLFGFLNIFIGFANFVFFKNEINSTRKRDVVLWMVIISFSSLILLGIFRANQFVDYWNDNIFKHPVIYQDASPYQNIVLTNNNNEFRLYLNSAIQFSSRDEYRYHEALIHVPGMQVDSLKNILILGGGEGLAAREVLKYPFVEQIDLIELDPEITRIASEFSIFKDLNDSALLNEKVNIIHDDAFTWLIKNEGEYDMIIADLPDPTNESLSRLYSINFYHLIINHLNRKGVFVTQATSPELSPNAFWCIGKTMEAAGFNHIIPYQANVPSFGNWGFVFGSNAVSELNYKQGIVHKFLSDQQLKVMQYFPKDVQSDNIEINRLDQPIIMKYYLEHWKQLNAEKI